MEKPLHIPVLFERVLEYLSVRPGGVYVDATLGLAGHAAGVARRLGGAGKLICFDRDPEAMAQAKARMEELAGELGAEMPTVVYEPRAFSEAHEVIAKGSLDGLLADFGVSSLQLDEAHRGFSFRSDGPLDMRMDTRSGRTAGQVVNQEDENVLADLIYEFGEERRSRRIARALVRARPIETTAELARVISAAAPSMKGDKIHPATRTFQAIRMVVNDELGELERGLLAAERLLEPGGRLVVVSFHSLEDRVAKAFLAERAGRTPAGSRHLPPQAAAPAEPSFDLLRTGALAASDPESAANPRARSAKLRAAVRLPTPAWPMPARSAAA